MDNTNDIKTNKNSHSDFTKNVSRSLAEQPKRLSPEEIDELYIMSFLDNPAGSKINALRRAGHPKPTPQRAWQIHDRLADQIDKRLDRLIMQDAALGRSTLVELCKSANSDAVRASSAAKLMEYAGKQKPDRLIVESRTPEDIDIEIAAVQRRILEAQGDEVPESEIH